MLRQTWIVCLQPRVTPWASKFRSWKLPPHLVPCALGVQLGKVNVLGMLIQKKTLERAPSCLQSIKEDSFAKQLPWGYDSSGHWTVNSVSSRGDLWTNWNINLFTMYIQYKLPHLSFLEGEKWQTLTIFVTNGPWSYYLSHFS